MQYFDTLPKVLVTDNQGISRVFTNIIARASIMPEFLKNPAIYYKYDIQDGDTPEIIAHKYYGDVYRYWIVLFANELLDPQWNWPMTGSVFANYINEKYVDPYQIHHYEKEITSIDLTTNTTTVEKVTIDSNTFNTLNDYDNILTFPNGDQVKVILKKYAVDIYQYEYDLNESKRNIQILNSAYVGQIENQFKKLMAA